MSPVSHAGRILVVLTVCGVFFWLQIWTNQMKMEMVAFDTSSSVRTLEEAEAADMKLELIRSFPETLEVEAFALRQPTSTLGRLLSKSLAKDAANNKTTTTGPVDSRKERMKLWGSNIATKRFRVMSRNYLRLIAQVVCVFSKAYNPKIDFLIGKDVVLQIPAGPWINRILHQWIKDYVRMRTIRMTEHGFVSQFSDNVHLMSIQKFGALMQGALTPCIFESVEKIIDAKFVYKTSAIRMEQVSDVFTLLFSSFMVCFICFVAEVIGIMRQAEHKYAVMRRGAEVRKQRIKWQIRAIRFNRAVRRMRLAGRRQQAWI